MPADQPRTFALHTGDALFLDFDGTLAALQDDAESVHLLEGMADVLLACAERLSGALAVLSGRDLDDLSRRVPDALWRFGNHGLRAAAPGESPLAAGPSAPGDLIEGLTEIANQHPGVHIERKGLVIAVHYRAVPDAGPALGEALSAAVGPFENYGLQHGKMVYEAKPAAANKGACLLQAMQETPFAGRRPVMIGDDTTDEDAFAAAQSAGGVAAKVGQGNTVADFRLASVQEVHDLLKEFASA